MIRLRLGEADLLRSRFAVAPLWEATAAVRAVRHAGRHLPWLRPAAGRAVAADLGVLPHLLPPTGYAPDFLTPPPTRPLPDPEDEFDRLRGLPLDVVAAELARSGPPPAVSARLPGDPAAALAHLAASMRTVWRRLLAPQWPRMRDLLEADIAYRAAGVARGGFASMLGELHPGVRWAGGWLEIDGPGRETLDLAGRGLLLVPSLLHGPVPSVQHDRPWQPTLIYPARGAATLGARPEAPPGTLTALLGRSRAAILAELDEPMATGVLARRLGLSPATVSGHLKVLLHAGLLTARRAGRQVHYGRTPLGTAVVSHGRH
ncbi:ArsR/SmtB family transcription factor [Nonomuraea candida]|uniref:ArsR/SmtB family transcription factor n=1 Tax=Nonomuraea candida TaxID=359159 RepID=UPI0005BE4236|nr:DUF5937 family protein [Nonomuraea candida]